MPYRNSFARATIAFTVLFALVHSAASQTTNVSLAPSRTEFPSISPTTTSVAPSSTTSDWICQDYDDPFFPYLCYNLNEPGYGMEEAFVQHVVNKREYQILPLFLCRTGTLTNDQPNIDDCDRTCYIQITYPDTVSEICASCAIDGDALIYDCRNTLPTVEEQQDKDICGARNVDRVCGDYIHWTCIPEGYGYACVNLNRDFNSDHSAFPFDRVKDSQTILYCADDISGLDTSFCEEPACNIVDTVNPLACSSCSVLPQAPLSPYRFEYNCELFENMTCPILDSNGTCVEKVEEPFKQGKIRGIDSGSDASNSEDKWTWTIESVGPTAFNVISDLIGYLTHFILATALAMAHPLLLTLQLTNTPRKRVPLKAMGNTPGNMFQAFQTASWLSWSLPAILLLLMIMLADFAHTIADSGLSFVETAVQGIPEPVLVLGRNSGQRNADRLMKMAGDPPITRTAAFKVASEEGRSQTGGKQTTLESSFVSAVSLIARGESPFTKVAPVPMAETVGFGGVPDFDVFYMPDDTPIAALDFDIPLTCESLELAEIEEVMTGFPVFDKPIYNTARVPNCTFSNARESGIFPGASGRVEIVEHLWYSSIAPTLQADGTGKGILLRKGNETFQEFVASPDQKKLARDREDWKRGRVIDAFDSLEVGNLTVELGHIVLATGSAGSGGSSGYGVIGEVIGECPPRPSALPKTDTQCLAIIELSCQTFPEDIAAQYHPIYYPQTESSDCRLGRLSMVWGRNFEIDADVINAVAGIFGLIRPSALGDGTLLSFQQLSVLSAIFMMGTVQTRPSNLLVVQAQVDAVYVTFMILPLILAIFLFLVVKLTHDKIIPIPTNGWDMMVLGKEIPVVPLRSSNDSPFPPEPTDIFFYGTSPNTSALPKSLGLSHRSGTHTIASTPPNVDSKSSNVDSESSGSEIEYDC